jgi:hypothetical protein
MRRAPAVEPEHGGIFAHHAADRVRIRALPLLAALAVVLQPEQRPVPDYPTEEGGRKLAGSDCRIAVRRMRLLRLVGVEDCLHPLPIDGGRLDARAFDLQ